MSAAPQSGIQDAGLPEVASVEGKIRNRRSAAYSWLVVLLLTVAATLSIIDRQILALMIGPVKQDLGVSDTMMGLLGGLAFTLFYAAMSLPMAWLSDRTNRRNIIVLGILFWSAATVACGLASKYWQLFTARMAVGVGEATLSPAAISMLADYFEPRRLSLALGVFSAAPFIGVGLANILGGAAIAYIQNRPDIVLPFMGTVRSWQAMFIIVGLPGILLALVMLVVREPPRQGKADPLAKGMALPEAVSFLGARRRFLAFHFIGFTALAIQGWAVFYWIVEFFVREHGGDRASVGMTFGTIALVLGTLGSVTAGLLSTRMMRAGQADATLRLVMVTTIILLPVGIASPLVPGYWTAMGLIAVATFLMAWPTCLAATALQLIVPNELRGQIMAFYYVVVNFLSYTLGPLLGGLISDTVFGGRSLGGTLALMAAVNYPVGAWCMWRCLTYFRTALAAAETWRQSPPEEARRPGSR